MATAVVVCCGDGGSVVAAGRRADLVGGDVVAGHDLEAEVGDHFEIFLRVLALGGQVVADEHRVGGVQAHRLQPAEVDLAATGDADFDRGVRETQQSQHL